MQYSVFFFYITRFNHIGTRSWLTLTYHPGNWHIQNVKAHHKYDNRLMWQYCPFISTLSSYDPMAAVFLRNKNNHPASWIGSSIKAHYAAVIVRFQVTCRCRNQKASHEQQFFFHKLKKQNQDMLWLLSQPPLYHRTRQMNLTALHEA